MIETREMLAKRKAAEASMRERRAQAYAEKMGMAPTTGKSRYETLKEDIGKSLGTIYREWWKLGEMLCEIKNGKLYLEDGTWEQFCASYAKMSKSHADNVILNSKKLAEIHGIFAEVGQTCPALPESVVRELSKVPAESVVDVLESVKGRVTAKSVRDVASAKSPKKAKAVVVEASEDDDRVAVGRLMAQVRDIVCPVPVEAAAAPVAAEGGESGCPWGEEDGSGSVGESGLFCAPEPEWGELLESALDALGKLRDASVRCNHPNLTEVGGIYYELIGLRALVAAEVAL